MKKFLFIFLSLMAFFSCKKEKESQGQRSTADYIIFGFAASECAGNCAQIFKLEGNQLFPDKDVNYFYIDSLDFVTQSLASDKVSIAQTLINDVPNTLYDVPNGNIGCPDCRDQGLFYLEISTDQVVQKWVIDRDNESYKTLCDSIGSKIQQITQ